jgi:virulence-associated protein VapD
MTVSDVSETLKNLRFPERTGANYLKSRTYLNYFFLETTVITSTSQLLSFDSVINPVINSTFNDPLASY